MMGGWVAGWMRGGVGGRVGRWVSVSFGSRFLVAAW